MPSRTLDAGEAGAYLMRGHPEQPVVALDRLEAAKFYEQTCPHDRIVADDGGRLEQFRIERLVVAKPRIRTTHIAPRVGDIAVIRLCSLNERGEVIGIEVVIVV